MPSQVKGYQDYYNGRPLVAHTPSGEMVLVDGNHKVLAKKLKANTEIEVDDLGEWPKGAEVTTDCDMPWQAHDHSLIALDKNTVRRYDQDGRLHVETSNISKANVCPYFGREIPRWKELGLDPDKLYQLYRDPQELAQAAPTFNNLPVLSEHVPVTAEAHKPELVVGSTGTDATFEHPYLCNSLVLWAKPAIEGVESEGKRELSSAYYYDADMVAGQLEDGTRYDGVMRHIRGNHVALVEWRRKEGLWSLWWLQV
jgi:hypothetical protein